MNVVEYWRVGESVIHAYISVGKKKIQLFQFWTNSMLTWTSPPSEVMLLRGVLPVDEALSSPIPVAMDGTCKKDAITFKLIELQ